MAIREELVASAAKFLLDPSVAGSPIEKRIAFLQAKNLTPEEVNAALARVGPEPAPGQVAAASVAPPSSISQQPPYYAQYAQPSHQYPAYAWQPPPQEVPRRDWRDWFIMATVVSGVSYGLYTLGKRYVYPLVAPPTPERLEQDKKSIDEQFEKTFTLVDQLAKDTEALKAAEQERKERLDTALGELESALVELKSANRKRDDEAQIVRDELQGLKDSIPRALGNQKDLTDRRLQEVNAELKSLKTLITQRMNPTATSTSVNNYLRPSSGTTTPAPATGANDNANASSTGKDRAASMADEQPAKREDQATPAAASSSFGRSSPFSSGMATTGTKASIPAWQLAMSKNAASSSSSVPATNGTNGTNEAAASP